jgi:nickel-dependent lactate racemase
MNEISVVSKKNAGIKDSELRSELKIFLSDDIKSLKKVLLVPPDYTRLHSGAGKITALLYLMLKEYCRVDVIPALGTHEPMSDKECFDFFGPNVPLSSIYRHDWRNDIIKIGTVPGDFISEISEGLVRDPIDIEVNKILLDKSYDLIISIGQVVPHEVIGMANYSKNILVGLGGSTVINRTHMLGAVYDMERIMGRDFSPVRKVLDYAEEYFLKDMPLQYILTVTSHEKSRVNIHGLFIGRNRRLFENAVALSMEKNMTFVDRPIKKAVVYLDEREFKSTWLGNKAIYRTRMAIADGGELLVLAPGVKKFGEDADNDCLIRKYGYCGRLEVLRLVSENPDLQHNLSSAAHLIHGSSDKRFTVTYAVEKMSRQEIEGVHFQYMPLKDALVKYDVKKLNEGWNSLPDGEEIFFIGNPALGLWIDRKRFK